MEICKDCNFCLKCDKLIEPCEVHWNHDKPWVDIEHNTHAYYIGQHGGDHDFSICESCLDTHFMRKWNLSSL